MNYPIEITLNRPVSVNGKTYTVLSFDEPDLGTSLSVEEAQSNGEQTIRLIAGMASVDRAVAAKIKESDYRKIVKQVLDPYQQSVKDAAGEAGNEPPAT